MKFILAIAAMFISSALFANPSLDAKGWAAFGDLRGNIEPCGCNPEADLGGILRLATFNNRERAIHKNYLLFSLGNNLSDKVEATDKIKTQYLSKGLSTLKLSASLANYTELETLSQFASDPYGKNLLLSNKKAGVLPALKTQVMKDDVLVFGYYFSKKHDSLVDPASVPLLERWKKNLGSYKRLGAKVLLFAGDKKDLDFFEKSKFFDLIVSSNDQPIETVVGPEEKEDPSKLNRMTASKNVIRMVPLGGQGVLRGGVLQAEKAKSLKEILDAKEGKSGGLFQKTEDKGMGILGGHPISWLDKTYEVGSPLEGLMKQYDKAASQQFERLVTERKSLLKNSPFAGSETCKGCHQKAFEVWQGSAHAHAFATLEKQQKEKDPSCVGCHVLGFSSKGGFVSLKDSPKFANVNCENCHGPRKEHTLNPTAKNPAHITNPKAVCTECHHGTHTPNFDFKEFWPKIIH